MAYSTAITVSDAHLLHPSDARTSDFIHFLASKAARTDLIVLNGDIFDFFVGAQTAAIDNYAQVIDTIEQAATQCKLVFVQGNHDFHLNRVFSPKVEVCDEWQDVIAGKKVLWIHGDTLAPSITYKLLRNFLRSALVRVITETLPSRLVWKLALAWSNSSRAGSTLSTAETMQALEPSVIERCANRVDLLVTGHYHLDYRFLQNGFVWHGLGDWLRDRHYLEINSEGTFGKTYG